MLVNDNNDDESMVTQTGRSTRGGYGVNALNYSRTLIFLQFDQEVERKSVGNMPIHDTLACTGPGKCETAHWKAVQQVTPERDAETHQQWVLRQPSPCFCFRRAET